MKTTSEKSISGPVKWGIIGCGDVCEIKSGPAFNKVANSSLIAVMRRDAVKAEDYARRHDVPRFYSEADDLINDPDVNAIYIATPPSSHEQYTEQALKAGKPVYVEKPVSLNASSCERMIALAEYHNGKVSVAHYRRGLSLFRAVKKFIIEGKIGNVRSINLVFRQPMSHRNDRIENWRIDPEISGGGLFHDLAPHQLDICYWLFGAPEKVSGISLNQSMQYNAPDMTMIQAVFKNKVALSGVWNFNVSESSATDLCEITGENGRIAFSFFRKSALEITNMEGTTISEYEYPENIQQPMIDAVTRYFRGEAENPCSLNEALEVMRMMDKTIQDNI